ncbi:MAG: UPF0104 family protein, partial [Polaromonas sp.]
MQTSPPVASPPSSATSSTARLGPERVRQGFMGKAWWPWAKRGLAAAFFITVASLLFMQARHIAWDKVLTSLQQYPLSAAW